MNMLIPAKPASTSKPLAASVGKNSTGLGRGLGEILSQAPTSSPLAMPSSSMGNRHIPLSQIVPNPRQPRLRFTEEPLDELAASIREKGILNPITVRPLAHVADRFEIIAGERRFRACQKLQLPTIPAIIKSVSDIEAYELSLIENLQRENLDPIEEARGYQRLVVDFSLTQEEIASKVGKNRSTVANSLRLLDLAPEVQGYLSLGKISSGHAKVLLGLTILEQQIQTAQRIIKEGLSVRQTERIVTGIRPRVIRARHADSSTALSIDAGNHYRAIEEALQQKLGMKVQLAPSGEGGRIEIRYFSAQDLDRFLKLLQIEI